MPEEQRSKSYELSWHSLPLGEVFQKLDTRRDGLSQREVERRLSAYGKNEIPAEKRRNSILQFLRHLISPLVFLLVVAGLVTIVLGAWLDAVVIFGVVILNAGVGFFHESRAHRALESIRKREEYFVWALRDGAWREISYRLLVPGDIFQVRAGMKISADSRLIESTGLEINESILTGESGGQEKRVTAVPQTAAIGDRVNMLFRGTVVLDGKGRAVVVTTGRRTEFGKISLALSHAPTIATPFERRVVRLGRFLAVLVTVLALILFGLGILTEKGVAEMFLISVAVAVSAVPESLPIAITVILAIGMVRILREKGLLRSLPAAEALGSTSVILADKTGTLTEGKMTMESVLVPMRHGGAFRLEEVEPSSLAALGILRIGALISEAEAEGAEGESPEKILGRPTDVALYRAAAQAGIQILPLREQFLLIDELPFNSERKATLSLRQDQRGKKILFIGGAPEVLLAHCSRVHAGDRVLSLSAEYKTDITAAINNKAHKGFRLLLLAYKEVKDPFALGDRSISELIEGATVVGLVTLRDPVRKEVKEAIAKTRAAGIRTVIVTGDHALTAAHVGRELGLLSKGKTLFTIVEGRELEAMDDSELARRVRTVDIFARVSPLGKVKIVRAWQGHGEIVAMTGDGINDAPALQAADVGVTLMEGADLSKEAADLVLLESGFGTIVSAVREGRVIRDNLKKVVTYLLTDSFTEVILISASLFLGLPLPVLPVQILWVNLIADSLPAMALGFEPPESDVMQRGPERKGAPLIDRPMRFLIFAAGITTDLVLLGLFLFFVSTEASIEYVRTLIFGALAINSLFYVFAIRSLRRPLREIGIGRNRYLILSVLAGIFLTALAIYAPPLQALLHTVPLGYLEWIILIGFGMVNIAVIEFVKWFFVRRRKST